MLLTFSKIIEKCLYSRLSKFAADHNVLAHQQFGFRKGLSTEHAVSAFCEHVYDSLDKKYHTVNVFIDLQKAYDTIDRNILLGKLEKYGIRGLPLRLISSFLSDRSQVVRVGDTYSDKLNIPIGLPTGSVLSCLLFLLYVNDLPHLSQLMTPFLYADDTTLSFSGPSMEELAVLCNSELDKFNSWTEANRLSINANKTFSIIISNKSFDLPALNIKGNSIEHRDFGKFLGVTVDSRLNFKRHISEVSAKISKSVGILFKLKPYLPSETLLIIYYSLVFPYLNYCSIVWGNSSTSLVLPLVVLQKKCIRIICKSSYLAHSSPLFKQCNVLKFHDIFKLKLAIHIYRNRDFFESSYSRPNLHNTRFSSQLLPSFQRLSSTQKSIHFQIPHLWNSIPDHIKNSPSVDNFKIRYKRYLTSSYVV